MTPDQIKIVKLSFVPVMGQKLKAGRLFYQRLFEIAPETRPMFKTDDDEQAKKLMGMLGIAISNLTDSASLVTMLEDLGRRHVTYGVRDEHYAKVRDALFWTLETLLGDAFTAEARKAWTELYDTVSAIMRGAKDLPRASVPRAVAGK